MHRNFYNLFESQYFLWPFYWQAAWNVLGYSRFLQMFEYCRMGTTGYVAISRVLRIVSEVSRETG